MPEAAHWIAQLPAEGLPLLAELERYQLLREWNDTAVSEHAGLGARAQRQRTEEAAGAVHA